MRCGSVLGMYVYVSVHSAKGTGGGNNCCWQRLLLLVPPLLFLTGKGPRPLLSMLRARREGMHVLLLLLLLLLGSGNMAAYYYWILTE